MGFTTLRETWKQDRTWGKSVPAVPEDHVELPRKGAKRFDGNHGAWMTPLGMIALLLCVLATLSTPICEPMSLIEMTIKADLPGGPGTSQKLRVGLWGFCVSGADGDCSRFRGLFSSFGKVSADLPEHLNPLSGALTGLPQAFLNAVGVFPILANAYIYFGAIYAAWSSTFFERKQRRTLRWQQAALACFHWVIIWISISFGLMLGFYYQLKANVNKTEIKDFIDCKIGCSVWILLACLIFMLYISVTWYTWLYNSHRGVWQPAAWMMYICESDGDAETAQPPSTDAVASMSKEEEARQEEIHPHRKSLDRESTASHSSDLPCYTATASAAESVVSPLKATNEETLPQTKLEQAPVDVAHKKEASAQGSSPISHAL